MKRIASLLHSARWKSNLILKYLWERANEKVKELLSSQAAVYVIWDESVLEKNESLKAEGLCAVRSTKAARLKRIKPGYFNPPTDRPIFVPGFNWLQLLVTGLQGVPVLAHLCWWTTRGEKPAKTSGRRQNPEKSGKRSWDYRMIWDARRRCQRKTGIIAAPIYLPNDQRPTLSGCFSPRIRAQALIPPHHRTNPHGCSSLANRLRLCSTLADRDVSALHHS